jgi:glycosyltransferase involved in cell wall biosynthesis
MATHNGEKFIREQLDSILSQLSPSDEIIISDDGSLDQTLAIINSYNDKRIKIYLFSQPIKSTHLHLYVTMNYQNALIHAKGDYIFLSDQDDYWVPNKVSRCIKELDQCDLVVHNLRLADFQLIDKGENMYSKGFKFKNYLVSKGSYFGCSMAFKRSVLSYVLPFPDKLLIHDYWIGMLVEHLGTAHYLQEPLIVYRLRDESISHKVVNSFWFKLSYRFYTLFFMVKRILNFKINGSTSKK